MALPIRRMRPLIVFALTLPWCATAAEKDLVAVLELQNQSKRVSNDEVQVLTDVLRGAATAGLDRERHTVLTRESMEVLLPPTAVTCLAGKCLAEIGRTLQAKLAMGGSVKDFGTQLAVTLEVYESASGALLTSEVIRAASVEDLGNRLQQVAPGLIRKVTGAKGSPVEDAVAGATGEYVQPPPPTGGRGAALRVEQVGALKAEAGMLRVEGSPMGARVEVSGPLGFGDQGKLATLLPFGPMEVPCGEYRVTVTAPEYDGTPRTVLVYADRTEVVRVDLEASNGTLEVAGTPAGARVDLACAKGFTRVFGLPGTLTVPRGSCGVKVTRSGYESFQRTIEVPGGKTVRADVNLAQVTASSAGGATNSGKGGIEWVRIPGGTFRMGSNDPEAGSDEKPVHSVTVESFELAKTEVTVQQYKECVDAGACTVPAMGGSCNWGVSGRDNHPANCVDWSQASAFSRWAGGRLPTEAEWEYAARSGGKDQKYPWGNEAAMCDLAVMSKGGAGCSRGGTWPACSKTAGNSAHGLCDLSGNVWEWVQDWYHDRYGGAPSDGSAWESPAGSRRVSRGGSLHHGARLVRAAYRSGDDPRDRLGGLGFRPSRSMPR